MVSTEIDTEDWNNIISFPKKDGWKIKKKYKGFDGGIDRDYLLMQ